MITSKKDMKYYFGQDLKRTDLTKTVKTVLFDRRYRFYKSLRLTEYYTNCKTGFIGKIIARILRLRHMCLCDKFGWTIPINVFGSGLAIVHTGTIVVTGKSKIGKNCRINACVNIGSAAIAEGTKSGAPILGDNVYIGPGAKIFGPIKVGSDTAIGANAVVNKSFEEGKCTIAGVPAKIISTSTSERYILNMNLD